MPVPTGSILLIGSVAARQASRGQFLSDYAASKGAVRSSTKELGVESAPYGIRVNFISPGSVMLPPLSFLSLDFTENRIYFFLKT
jgi:NAD(P)-dependent dehydrogenase (short-subunit alcohol dehydrogenase family)